MNLKEQIFDCLPAGRYALSGLLRLLDVVETEGVPSAAVECVKTPRLLVNPKFVAEHANTPEKLMMLVLHEVHHVLLGHTKRIPCESRADNFVFDCVINAMICRMFPSPEYTALFRDFYRDDLFPVCLLRPPEKWNPAFPIVDLPRGLLDETYAAARSVYISLYSSEGVSYNEIRNILPQVLETTSICRSKNMGSKDIGQGHRHQDKPDNTKGEEDAQKDQAELAKPAPFVESRAEPVDLKDIPLMGDHEQASQGQASASETAFAQAVGSIVREWPCPPDPIKGQSLNGMLQESKLIVQKTKSSRKVLRNLIHRIADAKAQGRSSFKHDTHPTVTESPIPVFNRRSVVSSALGLTPLLFQQSLQEHKRVPVGERVHIYVDVSGSMDSIKGAIYGAVLDCEPWVFPEIHLFSTQVHDVTPHQLRIGLCKTTGGTDIDCVIKHMRDKDVKRALLLTDGYVGEPKGVLKTYFKKVQLGVAYTKSHTDRDLLAFTKVSAVLPIA
jgi:hypothetical protein